MQRELKLVMAKIVERGCRDICRFCRTEEYEGELQRQKTTSGLQYRWIHVYKYKTEEFEGDGATWEPCAASSFREDAHKLVMELRK